MFKVGDKIVYPMHGAGIITAIEDLDLFGEGEETFYKIQIITENMTITLPVNKAEEVGVRPIVSPDRLEEIYEVLSSGLSRMNKNWSKRYQNNMEILKTGDIFEVAKVVKNLTIMNRQKGLSTGEKKMMTSARGYLVSELQLILDIPKEQATYIINKKIGQSETGELDEFLTDDFFEESSSDKLLEESSTDEVLEESPTDESELAEKTEE